MVTTFNVRRCDLPSAVVAGNAGVWAAKNDSNEVVQIDPKSNAVDKTVSIACPTACLAGPQPLAMASTDQAIWVRNVGNGTVVKIDPKTPQVVALIEVDSFYGRDGQ